MNHKRAVRVWIATELHKRGVESSTAATGRIAILLEGAVALSFILDDADLILTAKQQALEYLPLQRTFERIGSSD